jgi:hypothetical protein
MNRKLTNLSLLAISLTVAIPFFAQEKKAVPNSVAMRAEIINYPVYRPETVADSRCVRLKNGHNDYVLKFVEQKPEGNKAGVFQIRLREPCVYHSFSRPVQDFIRIRSGKIRMENLSPDLSRLKVWNKTEKSGVTLPLNFAGAKYELSFWITNDSPILFGRIKSSSGVLGDVEIQFNAVISAFRGIRAQNVYERRAVSNTGIWKADRLTRKLPEGTSYLILSDERLQPDREKKCNGPCYVQWDSGSLRIGSLTMPNDYHTRVNLIPRAESEAFDFGLLECKKPRTNAEFLEYVTPFLPIRRVQSPGGTSSATSR